MADPLLPRSGRSVTPTRSPVSQEVSNEETAEGEASAPKETEGSKEEGSEHKT
jgi:hypothetical protein